MGAILHRSRHRRGHMTLAVTMLLASLGFATPLVLQADPSEEMPPGGDRCPASNALFDTTNIMALSGEVVGVDRHGPGGQGLQVTVLTEEGKVPVHLGPAWYLEQLDLSLKPGDVIRVDGFPVAL